jgi:hypothetical protein
LFIVLEASVHGQLALLLWVCGEAEYHGGERWVEQVVVHLKAASQQREGAEKESRAL